MKKFVQQTFLNSGKKYMAVYKLIYKKKELKKIIQKTSNESKSPSEFEKWLSDNDGKFFVENDDKNFVTRYSANELAELINFIL